MIYSVSPISVILLKKKKKVPEPRYSKNPLSDFFVIGRLCYVCLTTKPTSILIGAPSQIYPDTKNKWNPIGQGELFFWHGLFWLVAFSCSAQLQNRWIDLAKSA